MDRNPQLTIREMKPSDATVACEIVRRSIRDLCVEDHKNGSKQLNDWLSNKTLANFQTWAGSVDTELHIAEINLIPVGVGCLSINGEVLLNYVKPGWQFHGVSKGLLSLMEKRLREIGVEEARLVSTRTAHRFYQNAGWEDVRKPREYEDLEMFKKLLKPTS